MKIHDLHDWDVGIEEAKKIQIRLAKEIILEGEPEEIRFIAGADVSYSKGRMEIWAGVVVFDIMEWEVIEEKGICSEVNFPYIPGYLSFREIPALLQVFKKIRTIPDIVLIDGQGVAHPRRMGIASHIGLFLDLPTVGCAKSRLIGKFEPVGKARGSRSELLFKEEKVGWVLRTRNRVKPIFISPGHRISMAKTVDAVLTSCGKYRIPEPIRRAHIMVNRLRNSVLK